MENRKENNLKWLAKINRRYHRDLDNELAPLRLNSSNYYFIVKIHDYNGLKQEELIKLTGLNGSNVTRTTQKLMDMGLVTKEKNEEDRRGFLLELTEEGDALYDQILDTVTSCQAKFLSRLTKKEQEIFDRILGKLSEEE